MNDDDLVEAHFLVPITEDAKIGIGDKHAVYKWEWLTRELYERYHGWTKDTSLKEGSYEDCDTGEEVADMSREYRIALRESELDGLRDFLKRVAKKFCQKSIYFVVRGKVEFIEGDQND